MSCSGSCKLSEKIWAVRDDKKLYRLTFSRDLAHFICKDKPQYRPERVTFHLGRPLQRGEISKSGLYGIMSKRKGIALRISLIKETAELYAEDESRTLCEAWITFNQEKTA
jgi:hypothetical protein